MTPPLPPPPAAPPTGHPPLVSILVPAYRAGRFLAETLENLLSHDYPNTELIVGDDGSDDDTARIARGYEPRVRLLELPHGGVSASRNALIAASIGPYLAMTDADDLWLPGKLRAQVAAMEANPRAGLCHTGWEPFGLPDSGLPYVVNDAARQMRGRCFERMMEASDICSPSVLLRRSALPPSGYPVGMRIAEDYCFYLQLLHGWEAEYLPAVYVRYRRHPSQATSVMHGSQRRYLVHNARARLRAIEALGSAMSQDERQRWRGWTLDALRRDGDGQYWRGEYAGAGECYGLLREHGRRVPLRRRLRVWLGTRIQ